MNKNIVLDTGFWFALFDERDQHHKIASQLADYLDFNHIIIPCPSLCYSVVKKQPCRAVCRQGFDKKATNQ